MKALRLPGAVALAQFLLCACGDTPSPQALCGGGPTLSFGARRDDASESVTNRYASGNGRVFLYINQDCEFWANDHSWFTYHGALDEMSEKQIHDALDLDALATVHGRWSTPACYDPPILSVRAASANSACICDCEDSETPGVLRRLNENLETVIADVAKRGTLWNGPTALLLVQDSSLEDQAPVAWPSEYELEPYVTDLNELGQSDAVPGGVPLPEPLRASLRALATEHATLRPDFAKLGDALPIEHEGVHYGAYLLDLLPLSLPRP